jgi:signal transduction histidine kinase
MEFLSPIVMNPGTPEDPLVLEPALDPILTEDGLRVLETDLRLANHLRALSQVSVATSHDIRTPLHTVILYLELLRNSITDAPGEENKARQARFVEVIGSELSRLEGMLEKLLSQTRIAGDKVERFDLSETALDLHVFLEPYRRKTRVEARLKAPEEPLVVEGNRDSIRHALVHILIRAIEGTPEGGELDIQVASVDGRATVVITGAGAGFPPHIFDGSRKNVPMGPALGAERGLHIARRALERHGGTISLRSGARSAATLEIRLPLAAAEDR